MHTDEAIREEIDRSIGPGPHAVPVDDLVARGHRALARRRALIAAGATLAVVAVGGTGVVAASAGLGPSAEPGFAGSASTAPTPRPDPASISPSPQAWATPTRAEVRRALREPLAEYDDLGRLVLAPFVDVVQRIDDPYTLTAAEGDSVALVVAYQGAEYWVALYQAPNGDGGSATTWAGDQRGQAFETWVRDQRSIADTQPSADGSGHWDGIPNPNLVRFVGSTERLEPVAGNKILEQQPSVSVGASFALPGDRTAAAKVQTPDGTCFYVLARVTGGSDPQYIGYRLADGTPTLPDFLDLARSRYAEGGGGLL